jgi:hypothetical protein
MSAVKDILQYGTHAARPAAAAGNDGKYYRETDTGSTFQSNGSTWVLVGSGAGAGTIGGSTGSTDNAIIRADGTGGATEQSSLVTIDDSGTVNIPTGQTYDINGSPHTHAGGSGAATTDHFVTTQTEGDLSAAIVIPGLAGSRDKVAGGGSDDEFTSLSGWTTLGALDTLNASDFASHLHIKKNTSGTQVDGIYKACPTIPFTMTAKMVDYSFSANYHSPGIMLAEASPGKIMTFAPIYSTPLFEVAPWTNRTTRGSPSDYNANYTFLNGAFPLYLRLVVNSSTNIDVSFSSSGFLWHTLATAYNPGFTVGAVGFCLMAYNAIACEAVYDWVRFT